MNMYISGKILPSLYGEAFLIKYTCLYVELLRLVLFRSVLISIFHDVYTYIYLLVRVLIVQFVGKENGEGKTAEMKDTVQ